MAIPPLPLADSQVREVEGGNRLVFLPEVKKGIPAEVVVLPAAPRVFAPFSYAFAEAAIGLPLKTAVPFPPKADEVIEGGMACVDAFYVQVRRPERPPGPNHDLHCR